MDRLLLPRFIIIFFLYLNIRDETMQAFSRAMYILYDIKYLLTTSPTDEICKTGWTDKLRKGFLHGVSNLLDILAWMQGMDLQVRQTTHHIGMFCNKKIFVKSEFEKRSIF